MIIFVFALQIYLLQIYSIMKQAKPITIYLLVIMLAFQSLGELFGGISLVICPSGALLKMPAEMLNGSPFNSFLIPGLILLLILGVLPGFLAFAVIRKPAWNWAGVLNIYRGVHWAWTYSLYLGIMLVIWILVEIIWIDHDILQTVYGLVGVVILVVTLLPANMRYSGWRTNPSSLPLLGAD
jgi:hypothetical protein